MTGAETAFDTYASTYDAHFTGSDTGRLQRARVWKFLAALSPQTHREVLEIGCGTGEDARWLSGRGFRVTATDASEGMVTVAKEKLADTPGMQTVTLCKAEDAARRFSGKQFDLVFSDFGALNCLSPGAFEKFALDISAVLRPGGRLVLVIMGRSCRWERFYFKRKGDRAKAFRRQSREGVKTTVSGSDFLTWYYSPAEIRRVFAKDFSTIKIRPVGLFLPPSYLDRWFASRPGLLKLLNIFEALFPFAVLAGQADHFYIELERK